MLTVSGNGKTPMGSSISTGTEPDCKPKIESFPPLDIKPATTALVADTKAQLPVDVKPLTIKVEERAYLEDEDEGEEDGYEEDDVVVPHLFQPYVKPEAETPKDTKPTSADLQRAEEGMVDVKPTATELHRVKQEVVVGEEGEEEEYDDDDVVAPWAQPVSIGQQLVKRDVTRESATEEDEEEEEYEEEDWIVCKFEAVVVPLTLQP